MPPLTNKITEPAVYRKLFDAIGLGHLFDPSKAEGPNQSRYTTVDGEPITKKGLKRHEMVIDTWQTTFDNQPAIVPSPQQDMMPGYPIMPTPIGNLIETAAGASGEVHPLLGLLTGVAAGRFDKGLGRSTSRIPYDNYPKIQTYGKYTNPSDHSSLDKLVSQWASRQGGVDTDFDHMIDAIMQFKQSGQGLTALTNKIPFWDQSTRTLSKMSLPEYQQRLLDIGEHYPSFQDNLYLDDFGRMRNVLKDGYMTQYADMRARMADIDFPDAQHMKSQVTAENIGEVIEKVLKYQKDINPYSLIDIGLTPGGARLFDISNLARLENQGPRAIQKQLGFLEDIESDILYRQYEQSRAIHSLDKAYDKVYPYDLTEGVTNSWYDTKNQAIKDIGGYVSPNFDEYGKWMEMPKIPIPPAIYDVWQKNGIFSAARLSPKPERIRSMDRAVNWRSDRPIPDELEGLWKPGTDNPLGVRLETNKWKLEKMGKGPTEHTWVTENPPYTYQHLLTLGNMDYLNPTAMRTMDKHNSIISNLRRAQGLSDPIRPDLGINFTSSEYLDPILETVPPAYKQLINKNLKFGLAGPGLLHMAMPEEEPDF